ncbi:hypothetical protein [Actinomadura sp. 21ATH]|uniref:hypothetical protein n=1 Tax=Actinomadura sp. 21ATH TaxID=1735444 RepID=UPI0035C0AF3D
MDESTPERDPLAVLGAHLGARGLAVEPTARGLRVTGRSSADPVLIDCRARRDDGGRMWFFTSAGEPVAEAGRFIEAALVIRGILARGTRAGAGG